MNGATKNGHLDNSGELRLNLHSDSVWNSNLGRPTDITEGTIMTEMIFLMGSPAAGKTTIANERYADTHVFIDCDLIKSTHPDYDPKNPSPLHAWSAEEADRIFQSACEVGQGRWVVDGTGANAENMVHDIKRARAAGFAIGVLWVKCSLETSLRRNARRERVVPEEIVRMKARTIATSFEIVSGYADTAEVFDNDAERQ